MNDHQLSVTTPESVLVTWKIPIFFHLSKNNACYLLSPGFKFVGDSFRLRLFRWVWHMYDGFGIVLETMTNTAPANDVSYEIGLKSVTGKEIEIDRRFVSHKQLYYFRLHELEKERQVYFSDGNITVFCFIRMRGPSSAENPLYSKTEIQKYFQPNLDSFVEPFGELSFESPLSLHVLWKIPNFFKLTEQSEYSQKSPEFSFGDDHYCLRLFQSKQSGQKRVSFKVVNVFDSFPKTDVSYEVGLKSSTGKEIGIDRNIPSGQLTLTQPVPSLAQFLLDREFFTDRESILRSLGLKPVPGSPLTVFCSLRLREPNNAGDRTSDEEEQERLPGMAKLQSDFRELLKKKLESDATLVVGGKEFPAHKIILRARSSVFDAMFSQEMAEKESGRVVIDDLDPETFGCFLEYLYTGVVGVDLSDNNVFELYKVAHKYNVPTLKSECVAHLRRNMSVDFFCEAVRLALLYEEQELFQKATGFFQRNMDPIILTAKWQQFLIENGTVANELLVKAITFKRQ